jgi:hypothetical protein
MRVNRVMVVSALLVVVMPAHAVSWASVLQFVKTMQSELSAWAVTTKQTSVAANQVAEADRRSAQQLATAMGAITSAERLGKAVISFDSSVGQALTNGCRAHKDATMQVEAWDQVRRDRSKLLGTFAATRVSDSTRSQRERVGLHNDSYCTVGEAKSGVCALKANGMQGWDTNYSGAFGERTLSAEGELAGYAYAAMVADVRAPAALDCKSVACGAAASDQLALAAAGTMVADSLVGQVLERRVPMITGK